MNIRRIFIQTIIAATIVSLLSGCGEATVEKVEIWKSGNKVSKLIKAIRPTNDQDVRFAAMDALGELKAEEAVDPLASLFSDHDFGAVLHSIEALAQINTPAAQRHLFKVFEMDTPRGQAIAAEALGAGNNPEAVAPLIKALKHEYAPTAIAAAKALGQLGNANAIEALSATIQHRSQPLRLACTESLASIGGETAVPGLARVLGDMSDDVRNRAVTSLVESGKPAIAPALAALESENQLARKSGQTILKALDAVPTTGRSYVWYRLGEAETVKDKIKLDDAIIRDLSKQGAAISEALLQAVAHPAAEIREHALFALLEIGEPCVEQALKAAKEKASDAATKWFNGRNEWHGSPSWRLALWGALVALNPNFTIVEAKASDLEKMNKDARRVMNPSKFKASREYVPLLIEQLGYVEASSTHRMKEHVGMATRHLNRLGRSAAFPLLAAIGDSDLRIAGNAALILMTAEDVRAKQPIIDAVKTRMESPETMADSALYSALQKIADPELEDLLIKIPPNAERGVQVFSRKYPDTRVIVLPNEFGYAGDDKPIEIQLGYYQGKRVKEITIPFRKFKNGDWKPHPALPDTLPQ
jgi:HEAT repeat protein